MKTLILEEQSDLGLHCLPRPICPKNYSHYGNMWACKLSQVLLAGGQLLLFCHQFLRTTGHKTELKKEKSYEPCKNSAYSISEQ